MENKKMKINLNLSEEQSTLILEALEYYSQIKDFNEDEDIEFVIQHYTEQEKVALEDQKNN
jgi:hypothetical protein